MSTINNLPSIGNKTHDRERSIKIRNLSIFNAEDCHTGILTLVQLVTKSRHRHQSNQPASVELGFNVQNELHPLIHGRFTPDQLKRLSTGKQIELAIDL